VRARGAAPSSAVTGHIFDSYAAAARRGRVQPAQPSTRSSAWTCEAASFASRSAAPRLTKRRPDDRPGFRMPLFQLRKTQRYDVSRKSDCIQTVQLLDDTQIECTLTVESVGRECLENVLQRIGVTQVGDGT